MSSREKSVNNDEVEYKRLLEIQRKSFEAQFGTTLNDLGFDDALDKPSTLEPESRSDVESISSDSDNSENEFSVDEDEFQGFSDADISDPEEAKQNDDATKSPEVIVVKFIENTDEKKPNNSSNNGKSRLLRKGKIPSLARSELAKKINQIEIEQELLKNTNSKEDMENLENDIELQRLLSESHILSGTVAATDYSGADLTLKTIDEDPFGKARARTMAQRLSKLSSQTANSKKLQNMPMNMRKGMLKKELERVKKHELEAKNSGTILSKVGKYEIRDLHKSNNNKVGMKADMIGNYNIGKKKLKEKTSMRQKGLKIHSIGRSTRNGLVINEKELSSMVGKKNKRRK